MLDPPLVKQRNQTVQKDIGKDNHKNYSSLQHQSLVFTIIVRLTETHTRKKNKRHRSPHQPPEKQNMHLLVADRKRTTSHLPSQPTQHVNVEKTSNTDNQHHHEEKYVRMSHLLIVTSRRLPLTLPHQNAHQQEESTLANVAQQSKSTHRSVLALFAHIVNIVMVEENPVKQETNRP